MFVNESFHLFVAPAINNFFRHVVCFHVVFDEFVSAESFFTFLTVHQRIAEAANVTGSYPCLRVHEDRAVNTYVVRAFLDEFFPPSFLYVVFQFHTDGAVIPCVCQTTVNFRAGVYKTSVFRQRYDFFHCLFCHLKNLLQKFH